MIKVNGRDYPWKDGLTIQELLKEMNFTFPLMVVVINQKAISKDEYSTTLINDGDDIKAIHLISGG